MTFALLSDTVWNVERIAKSTVGAGVSDMIWTVQWLRAKGEVNPVDFIEGKRLINGRVCEILTSKSYFHYFSLCLFLQIQLNFRIQARSMILGGILVQK